MIPFDLSPQKIILPDTDDHSIVLITGSELRHQRFAYRLQQEFGELVLAWYQTQSSPPKSESKLEKEYNFYQKVKHHLFLAHGIQEIKRYTKKYGFTYSARKASQLSKHFLKVCLLSAHKKTGFWLTGNKEVEKNIDFLQTRAEKLAACEKALFEKEVDELKREARLEPIVISNPNSQEFVHEINQLSPYFFLSLNGPLYHKELLNVIRGLPINQHAGWSPTYKGANTVFWPLYHRNLDYVGCTVHITTTGADAGPVFRRSHPCLVKSDTPESCFARTVALGTELMIEVVQEIIENKEIFVYEQPINQGKTYIISQMNAPIYNAIWQDFLDNWLVQELSRLRQF